MGPVWDRILEQRRAREERSAQTGERQEEVFENGQEVYLYRNEDFRDTKKPVKVVVVRKLEPQEGEEQSYYDVKWLDRSKPSYSKSRSSQMINAKDGRLLEEEKNKDNKQEEALPQSS
ncbi:hypothetical protein HYFRA_00010347 [Hymenoscyphus fraxineus]|uniref:Uncharacterized protein n=1 Tax=Hymenoscyphus fraxineus TaxID=746836 RepID=A0A9N9KW75_9HELO|nr:hypothetical protein HYFRA_00010347 [Hymenoscyphus fraxineus]